MEITTLVFVLMLMTLLAALIFAIVSKRRVEERRENDEAPKSTLAKDTPDSTR